VGARLEAYVIHPNSIAVSREHSRAKTDRLDTAISEKTKGVFRLFHWIGHYACQHRTNRMQFDTLEK
jgi:hypothetical protein